MPTYVYSAVKDGTNRQCDVCSGSFETVQKMSDESLTKCPTCGGAIERVILPPNLNGAGKYQKPSNDRLAKAGFTQYKKSGKGYYEKTFGGGPSSLMP